MASKLKVTNEVKGHNPQKAHLHPLRDVCMQYENNPANTFWETKHGRTARHVDDNIRISNF